MNAKPSRSEVIEQLALDAYEHNVSSLDFAETVVRALVDEVTGLGMNGPAAELLARRVIGALMDSGWTMPASSEAGQ